MSEVKKLVRQVSEASGEYHSPAGLSVSKQTVPPAVQTFGFKFPATPLVNPRQLGFRELYCEQFQCADEDYFEQVLWRCVYPDRLQLARVLWRFAPEYFAQECYLLEEIAQHADVDSITAEINDARYRFGARGLFRHRLHVRLSSQKLLALANELFATAK
ncbi:MAG: hypothetical protein RLZZ350_291 [Verrucomicrobiota bacterium]|jgi:hypothetical protein